MNDVKKKALWLSLAGFAMGIGIGLLFYLSAGPEAFLAQADHRGLLLLYFLMCGLYGMVNMGTSALYGIDEWSILRCTLTHFLISVGSTVIFFGVMIALGWMNLPPAPVCALTVAAFLVIYFLIWLIQFLSYKRQIGKMNAKLRAWKTRRKM